MSPDRRQAPRGKGARPDQAAAKQTDQRSGSPDHPAVTPDAPDPAQAGAAHERSQLAVTIEDSPVVLRIRTDLRSRLHELGRTCATTSPTTTCVHRGTDRYTCAAHADLGPLCGLCSADHHLAHHRTADACTGCGGTGGDVVPVLIRTRRGGWVTGAASCRCCLLDATTDGRRLAS